MTGVGPGEVRSWTSAGQKGSMSVSDPVHEIGTYRSSLPERRLGPVSELPTSRSEFCRASYRWEMGVTHPTYLKRTLLAVVH